MGCSTINYKTIEIDLFLEPTDTDTKLIAMLWM